jgi:hypothetical protein
MKRISTILAALSIALAVVLTGATAASAAPPDLNGDRVSWFGRFSCSDGGGVSIYSATQYATPSSGTYRLRLGLYRASDDGRLGLGPIRDVTSAAGTWQRFTDWNTYSSFTGEAYLVAYAYRWNGSAWALVAREWVPCL